MTERGERVRNGLVRGGGALRVAGTPEGEDALPLVLPPAPALLSTPDGIVARATEQAAKLAGETSSAALVGRKLAGLVVGAGEWSRLRGAKGDVAVRVMSWPHGVDPRFRVTVLVDVSDLVGMAAANPPAVDVQHGCTEPQRAARLGSWVFHPETDEFSCSPVLAELLAEAGVEDEDVAGILDLTRLVCRQDRDKMLAFWQELLESEGDLLEVELRDTARDRSYVCTGRAEVARSGRLCRLQGTVQDVTENRALERELREERRKLRDAQRATCLGTWEWEPKTGVTRLSGMMREITGTPPGRPTTFGDYLDAVHPADRERVERSWRPLLEQHRVVEVEHRYVLPDGRVRILRMHGTVIRDAGGSALLVGTAQDVTEPRAAVTRMERSCQRFTDLVAITPVGIGLFDQAERLVDANDALCDLLGYRLDQLRGMTARDLTPADESATALGTSSVDGADRRKLSQRLLLRGDGDALSCDLHVSLSVQDDGARFWLVVFQDVTEHRRTAEESRHQAHRDDLTGLPNRGWVKERLGQLLDGSNTDVAVLFCDVDNFKRVNDSLGHDAGDELLVALARRLETGLPPECTAARLSGDEFVIVCSDLSAVHGLDALAAKVSSLLRTAVPLHGQLIRVSASIGAAVPGSNGDGTSGERSSGNVGSGDDLLRFADAAMFQAKQRGTGCVSTASPALMASASRQMHLEGQLREALHRDELTLHYQPVVNAAGVVTSAEALVRWPHPTRGLLGPDTFLPVAEQGDLMRELDRWVLGTALREAASWPEQHGRQVGVAVNLSGLVPGGPDFVDAVSDVVVECGIDWHRVVLELVETALVDLPSRTKAVMGELVDRGVRFAVDDFGTGYSSLARLKELPAQIIKIDRRFVSGVGGDGSDFAVARAVVEMARAMGRECVAEGVETATQFRVLSGVGVEAYQGWLFSPAVPAPDFRNMLAAGAVRVPARG